MAFRLRHVQSVTLKRFDPCWQLHPDAQLHYELWRGLPDGGQQLLYVSEQVPLDFDLCWQPLSVGKCSVPVELLHRPFTDLLHLTVRAVQPSDTLIDAAAGAGSSFAGKQLEPHTGSPPLQDTQHIQPQQQQEHLEAAGQQLLYVRYVGTGFRVLLPWQLRQLEQQQDLQQQEGGRQHSQQDSKAQSFPALPALTPGPDEKLVTVCFDAATGTFKVGLAAAAAAAGLPQCHLQQQGREPALHNSKQQQQQPALQQPAPAHVHQQTSHTDAQPVSEDRVRLTYSNGSWRVEIVAAMQTDTMDASEHQSQHQAPQQQPLPPPPQQQQQQQDFAAIRASQERASPVVPSSQLLPLRAPAHQQHISWSPTVPAAAPAASPSHAAVVRARQARHTRNSSGCSDAALQLEQQLLEVFTTGSMSAGHGSSTGGSATPAPPAAAAGTLGGSVTPMDFFTAHQVDVSAAGVLADGVVDDAGGSDRVLSIGGNSPALPRTPDQPHRQQQQQQQAEALEGSSIHTRNSCQQQQYGPAAVTTQDSSSAVCCTSAVEYDSSADAIQQADSSAGNANSSLAGQGQLLLHFTFWVHDLSPCDPAELKTLPPGLQNPKDLHPNKLLLQLAGGLYTLPPQPQTPNPAEGPQLSPMASGEDWVGPEGFDSMRLGLASRQLSGQMAAVAQQQQLYRWMLSNSTGILDSLHHSYDEDDEQPGGHSRGSSAGGSSSALSLLGALFSRRSPQITAATAATGVSGDASPGAAGLASGAAAAAAAAAAAHGPVSRLLPSSSSAASLTTGVEGDVGTVPGDSGASSPQHVGVSIGGGVSALTQGSFSGSSRHRRTGSSTATSTALGVGAVLGGGAAAGAVGHRRAQSVSNGGVSWAPPYPKAPLSPASMASLAASGSAAANAAAAGDVPTAPAAAALTSSSLTGTATAATASGEDAAVPTAITHSSRLAGSIGGSSVSTAAAAQPAPADRPAAPASSSSGLGLLQRGFLAGFSFWDWGSVDDGVGLSAAGAPSERAAVERQYDVDEFVAATKRLISLHQRLHQVQERRDRIKHKVECILQQQCSARQQQQRRHMAQQRQQSAATLAAVRQQQLLEARGVLAAQRQQRLARCEGVQEAAGVLAAASQRLCEACGVLEGGEGLGQWKHLHAQLVARRNKLVAQLGTAFQVGPASKSPFAAAPLALQLDASWWAVDPDTAAEAGSDAGDTQQQQHQQQQQQPAAAVAHSQQQQQQQPHSLHGFARSGQQQQQEQHMPQLRVQAAQPRPQQAQPKQQQQQQQLPTSPTVPGPQSPAVDRLLVGGLELPSTLSKRGLQGSMGWGGDLDEEARVAAALGYVAHIVSLLSTYLDVPLRYPLLPRSSRSLIIDPAPVHSHSLETHVHRRFWGLGQAAAAATAGASSSSSSSRSAAGGSGGGHNSSSSPRVAPDGSASRARAAAAAAPAAGVEAGVDGDAAAAAGAAADAAADAAALQLPLYYVTGDRTRFAYAVFLLNKDIEQLLHVHGMSSQGPSQVLANLYKLITAAVSGLPEQQGPWQGPAVPGPQQQQQQQQGKGTCSNGSSSSESRGARALARPAASGAAAEAAAASAGAGAAWLQQLPLPPGHRPQPLLQQQPPLQQQPQGSQACRQQQGQQQHQQLPHQPQQQQQRRGFWRWPWQVEEGHEGQVVGGFPKPQQQQQPVIATWDWNDMLSDLPEQQQQQQRQQPVSSQAQQPSGTTAASNGSSVFDPHSWQQQHDAQLQSANQAAMAAEAAAAAAQKAASVAAHMLSQEVGGCKRQQQQQPTCADGADSIPSSRSLASLLSSKWAGDG